MKGDVSRPLLLEKYCKFSSRILKLVAYLLAQNIANTLKYIKIQKESDGNEL